MIKKRYSKNSNCLKLCALFLFPFALFGGISLSLPNSSFAAEETQVKYYNEKVSVTNSNFEQGGTYFLKGDSLSGWNAIENESTATGMLIDVGQGTNTEEGNNETTTFSEHKDDYMLSTNPGSHGNDNRILLINSKEKLSQKNVQATKGYRSSNITLEPNSYYVFSISAKSMLNGDDFASGSIYINGLKDNDGEDLKVGYENFTNKTWKEFYFYIATGSTSQTVTIDLYLGSVAGVKSSGAVFFDNVNVTRQSQNQFMESCYQYGFNNIDKSLIEYSDKNEWVENEINPVFIVNTLQSDSYILEETKNMNLDFEDEYDSNSDTLGEHWKIIPGRKSNASARIVDIRDMQPRDFRDITGYEYTGDDFSYDNSQALVLWSDKNSSNGGYVGIQSDSFNVEAHGIYKVSLKMKASIVNSGAFYIQVKENEYIYSAYPTLLNDDTNAKNYYALQSGKTSGVSANTTNPWENDYQTIELYIKGHELFNTSVNLELWFGDNTSLASGCVVVDNIKIERSTQSALNDASNKFELKWNESENSEESTINNASFNSTENSNLDGKYPIKATSWESVKENERYNESGVIYLEDNSQEKYNALYKNKDYNWAGINPSTSSNPNNVYMMFNSENSYQSILSNTATLSANSYYKLSFDYYNQDYKNLKPSKIKVEVIDENGITLFTKSNIQSSDNWSNVEIYIHTEKTVSHTIQVRVSLGDKDNKLGGLVYLDNFALVADASFEELYNLASNKIEFGSYYLNLDTEKFSGIKTSPAYSLTVDEVYDSNYSTNDCGCIGGIAYGKDNVYGIENESNLLVITNPVACSSTIKSNYKLTIEANKYYQLKFDLATFFGEHAGDTNDDHKECKFGVKVNIDGYETIERLVGKEELRSYSIYYHSTSSATPQISFTLVSDCDNSTGTAIITNLDFKESTEYEFANASQSLGYNTTVFTAKESANADNNNDNNDDNNNTDNTSSAKDNLWILIPSLIMGVALIIAVIGIFLRKVKIKKIEKVKNDAYDRKLSVNHDLILAQAQKKRDEEVSDLQKAKAHLIDEKATLEEEHKEYVKEQRTQNAGKLSKSIELQFKKYNSQIAKIDQKINIIKEKIDYCMTADYLLSLQRRYAMEEDERIHAEKRERKAKAKSAKKDKK